MQPSFLHLRATMKALRAASPLTRLVERPLKRLKKPLISRGVFACGSAPAHHHAINAVSAS
jgi:hypothetical protein